MTKIAEINIEGYHAKKVELDNSSNAEQYTSEMAVDIWFSMTVIGGKTYPDLRTTVRQKQGVNFESKPSKTFEDEPFEVGEPRGYTGVFNHEKFAKNIEGYLRHVMGRTGKAINITESSFSMINVFVAYPGRFQIQLPSNEKGGWE